MKKYLVILLVLLPTIALAASMLLTWDAPTTNTDGTPATDLAGYKLYSAPSPTGAYSLVTTITSSLTTSYTHTFSVPNNTIITKCYAMKAFDVSGNMSDYSNQVCRSFFGTDTIAPMPPVIKE